jgi:outer membrane protein OmpA-like peptidoglycan-associated protein
MLSAVGVALLLGLAPGRALAQDMRAVDMRAVDMRAVDMRAVDMRALDLAPAADLGEVPDQRAPVDAAAPPDQARPMDAAQGPGQDLAAPQEPLQFRGGGVSCAMARRPAPTGVGLFGLGLCLGLALVLRRTRRRQDRQAERGAVLTAMALALAPWLVQGEARAQAVDAIHFRPTGMPHGMVNVEGSATQPQGSVAATAYFSYATQPLLLVSGATGMLPEMGRAGVLSQALMNVAVTVGLGDMLALGLDVPVMLYQDLGDLATQRRIRGEAMSMTGGASQSLGGAAATDPLSSPQGAGVGDLRLLLKMRLLDNTQRGLGFALLPMVTVPSGDGMSYLGWGKVAFEGRAVLDYRFGNGVLLSANAALYVRETTRFLNLNLGNEFRYGGGMYWPVSERLSLLAEIFGRVGWTGPGDETSATSEAAPAEGLVGVRYRHDQGVTVQAGAGLGLGHGYGAPSSRVFLSFGYTPALGEGQARQVAAPVEGPAQGGKAPVQAPVLGEGGKGDKEMLAAAAPAKTDRDGDGVTDEMDRCPDRAGLRENMGCPDRDEDGDGVVDRLDQCPSVAGTREAGGCPLREGISPAQDAAQGGAQPQPAAPGAAPGAAQSPLGGELAQLRGWRFEMREPISFTLATATFTGRSEEVLREVAQVLKARPEIRLVRIEGHVDEPNNSAPRARALSRERAEAVKRKLVELGVSAGRLETQGYGYSRLLDRSETPEARLRNNRIEIVVLD